MTSQKKYSIKTGDVGQRLDKFLTKKMDNLTRSQVQKMIIQGQVTINNKLPTKHRFLKKDDEIEVDFEKAPIKTNNKKLPKVKIIDAKNDYIIVNKPAGLVVHPDSAHQLTDSLIGQLLEAYPDINNVGEDPERPGIIHRLDKNVSGIMVIARNQIFFEYLKELFKKRLVQKEYYALVHGVIDKNQVKIEFPIARKKTGFMAALSLGKKGRPSETIINVLNNYQKYTLLSVALITGRTHQIKVHLNAYNHPIVGEETYISKPYKKDFLQNSLKRPFLHAYQLKFKDLTNHEITYQSKLPADLQNIIKGLI